MCKHLQGLGRPANIIVMTGAGLSTSAGIPDFRTPGTGLYDNLEKYGLPEPQAIFSIDYLRTNPKPFFVLAKELFPGVHAPTLSHYFVALLAFIYILILVPLHGSTAGNRKTLKEREIP